MTKPSGARLQRVPTYFIPKTKRLQRGSIRCITIKAPHLRYKKQCFLLHNFYSYYLQSLPFKAIPVRFISVRNAFFVLEKDQAFVEYEIQVVIAASYFNSLREIFSTPRP